MADGHSAMGGGGFENVYCTGTSKTCSKSVSMAIRKLAKLILVKSVDMAVILTYYILT